MPGVLPVYAIPNLFGTLAAILIAVGAPSSAGTRFSIDPGDAGRQLVHLRGHDLRRLTSGAERP